MNIEEELFIRASVDFKKLEAYGFKKSNNNYVYEKKFLNDDFNAIITVNNKGALNGKVIDLQIDEEYLGLKSKMNGEFVNKVRDSYKEILIDIKSKCFETNYFINNQTNRINKFIKDKYNNDPEFLWEKTPGCRVYRNKNNDKWYAIIMNIDLSKIDDGSGEVEIINVKLNEEKVKSLINKTGFYKAYHMNKKDWITIILNDTLSDKEIFKLIEESYNIIDEKEAWIVPANPKYYDVINCFNDTDEVIWKQSSDIHVDDIVYLYVAEPYSKVMYKCKATVVNMPYDYKDDNLIINRVMKLKLLKRLDKENYTFKYLNSLGIKAIRGPRKIRKDLLKQENYYESISDLSK